MSLPLSAEDTIGPYYPRWFVDDFSSDLTVAKHGTLCRARGRAITVRGRLLDKHGDPADHTKVQQWNLHPSKSQVFQLIEV